ncbi:MAG TPA: hypothetical protein VHM30_10275 [Gemmatimonadaceae bacterium]|nr:hypothetical protein [Gemmatimonadaceae bacterium]
MLQRQLDSLRGVTARNEQHIMELDERTAGGAPARAAQAGDTARRRALASTSGIYGKPFLRRAGGGAAVGGYVDLQFSSDLGSHASRFDATRLVPFIFAEITDRLHFGTEIEFEHGPVIEVEDGEASGSGEVNVEFATLDYTLRDGLNIRAGMILSPLGRFNLVHDSPINDLTDRPLVDRGVIPTTLSESGVGLFGTLYPTGRSLLGYELYVVNGFRNPLELDGANLVEGIDVREARGERGDDNNAGKALVGRLAFSPFLGLEVGASAHSGTYAAKETTGAGVVYRGDERLTIAALDATLQHGPLELLGEYGRISIDLPRDAAGRVLASSVAANPFGFYAQANWHWGHGLLAPRASSHFTSAIRWDAVDDRGAAGARAERLTTGLNWRPVEDAVLKTDFQWNWTTLPGGARGDLQRRVLVSMATYF